MEKVIATGVQDFEKLRVNQRFYIDKTDFIARWWNGGDDRVFEFFCTGAFFTSNS